MFGPVRRAAGAALVALTVAAGLSAPGGPAGAAPAAACPTAAANAATATARARACKSRVELLDRRSERDQVFANPNGSYTLETSTVPRRVRGTDGSWAAVDTTLRSIGGRVRPLATAADLDFSAAGAGAMARIATAGGALSLTAPWTLPAPVLSGSRATYADVLPGVDLVLSARPDGFAETLVVRTRESLPRLRTVTFGVDTALTLTPQGGGFVAADARGRTVFTSPAPKMWDSSGGSGGVGAPRSPDGPAEGDRVAGIGLKVGEPGLTLTPDRALLDDPAAVLPLYIDPQVDAGRQDWAMISSGFPDEEYYNFDGKSDEGSGYCDVRLESQCNRNQVKRLIWEFAMPTAVHGTTILGATFRAWETNAWDCTADWVEAWQVGAVSTATNWNNHAGTWSRGLSAVNIARRSGCANGPGWLDFNVNPAVVDAAAGRWATVAIGLKAGAENTMPGSWKRFRNDAQLLITYNTPPSVPDSPATIGTSQRVGCDTVGRVNATDGVSFAATARDVDAGATVLARFEWQNVTAGTAVTALEDTPSVSPPHEFQASLPASSLPDGQTIQWRVRAFDGIDNSDYTPWCRFVVDNRTPGQPSITAPQLPPFPAGPPAGAQIGSTVTATFGPAAGDTDITGYYYGIGSIETAPTIWVPAGFDGRATAPLVPVASGLSKNFLTVVAVDSAGNRSPVAPTAPDAPGARQFRANAAGAVTPRPGDATGDGRADVTLPVDAGGGQATLWRWNATSGGDGLAGPAAVQDVEVRYPVATTRTVQGDFDGDRLSDVAVLTPDGANVRLSVQRSTANALLGAPAQILTGWNIANVKLVAGNFDGDAAGRTDIAVIHNDGNATFSIRVLLANGSPGAPTFAAPATWYTHPAGWADWVNMKTFAGDFDGDGRVDIGYLYQYPNCQTKMWVHYGTPGGFETAGLKWDSGAGAFCWAAADLVTGDFDADGRGDVSLLYDLGGCTATLMPFYGNADRTVTSPGRAWTSAAGSWCGGRTALSTAGTTGIAALYRVGTGFQLRGYTFGAAGRSFGPPVLAYRGAVGPRGTVADANLVLGATGSASSSAPSDWGWSLPAAIDGVSGGLGWSSWSDVDNPHTEWIELVLPEPGRVGRVVLFPRGDPTAVGNNFPSDFTIEVFDGTAGTTVVSRTGYPFPASAAGHHFTFPPRDATRIRVTGTNLQLMQFAEIEAYSG
ncbi:discoidin domain-containing protein [Paractinoplanes atraurantiacus]|uniref:F5/8 type C domain-containing protein n=1 Tax=Paractinoplanes atraurantiacus TaxID=1036182 RepID=A0A285IJF3_9ACTN|nr:discoidin domain-containing protein [Actinoplanes atraurantiacus]SNY48084.1 F5/8 type C domain-containing protein [Actinoplanes atraurantiacus]